LLGAFAAIVLNKRSGKTAAMARKPGSHASQTGPRVRDAALRLFARHGYAAVSMRQIAAEVGVQVGALYRYTADKQALLFDLMQAHMQAVLSGWEAAPKGVSPSEQLEAFVRFHIDFHIARPEAVFLSYMELRNLDAANFAKIEALRRAYEDNLESILRSGQAAGSFAIPDTKLATLALIGMLTGVNTWYREGGRLSRERIGDIYWDMVRRAVSA
jgi:AcrR family transcriptional regulator